MELSLKDHTLGHKEINKYKKIEITFHILSGHNGIKLEINSKRNCRKIYNYIETKQFTLNNQWIIEEIMVEIKKLSRRK
jgi:hypothetical protein